MKGTTYRLNFRPITDFTGITAWLEKMAATGWMLTHIGPHLWKFRRIEPRKVHFAAIYLSIDSNLMSPEQPPEVQTLQELCAGTGWYWVASLYQMQIFANEEPEPLPLETDPMAQVQNIHRTMKQRILPGMIGITVSGALLALLYFWLISGAFPYANINPVLFGGFCCILLVILELGEILAYYHWYRRASAAAETGTLIPSQSQITFQLVIIIVLLMLVVWWLSSADPESALRFLTQIGLIWLFRSVFGWMRRSPDPPFALQLLVWSMIFILAFGSQFMIRAVVRGMEAQQQEERTRYVQIDGETYALYQDEVPLKLEDLVELDSENQSYDRDDQDQLLYRITRVHQSETPSTDTTPWMSYAVYDVHIPLVYDHLLGEVIGQNTYLIWEEACRDGITIHQRYVDGSPSNTYLFCWEDRIVILSLRLSDTQSGDALTQEQLAIIIDKLGE